MKVLIIGGTGLISTGIVRPLLARGAEVWMLNRGRRENTLPTGVRAIVGDRHEQAVLEDAAGRHFDAVIDMVCFDPEPCRRTLEAFTGRTKHYVFCSTVCAYGVKVPARVLVDETFPREPISGYGRNKLACEELVMRFHAEGKVAGTVVRPSHTYGPGNPLIDNLEFDTPAWDRIVKGKPVLCADSGMGLWVSTHRDDCGKVFAAAVLNPKAYGQAYNATRDEQLTWSEYYRQVGIALGHEPKLVFAPAEWIWRHDPKRFGLLREITAFHGAYDSSKAKRDFPEFRCEIDLTTGAKETFADQHRRGAWKSCEGDTLYETLIEKAKQLWEVQP